MALARTNINPMALAPQMQSTVDERSQQMFLASPRPVHSPSAAGFAMTISAPSGTINHN